MNGIKLFLALLAVVVVGTVGAQTPEPADDIATRDDAVSPAGVQTSKQSTESTAKVTIIKDINGKVTVTEKEIPVSEKDQLLKDLNASKEVGDCADIEIIVRQAKRNKAVVRTNRYVQMEERASLGVWTYVRKGDGAFVSEVGRGTGADAAGLKKGDVITSINDRPVNSHKTLVEALGKYKPNDEVTVSFLRDGKKRSSKVKLATSKVRKLHVLMFPGAGLKKEDASKETPTSATNRNVTK